VRILAVDHGLARAGYAVCDPSGTIVTPLGVLEPAEPSRVAALAAEQRAEMIVLGLPVSLDGTEGEQAGVVRGFVAELAELTELPVETYDERLTTRLAEASARSGARAPADALAAAHLLESYLQGRPAEPGS
jgi:putative Holliday junction resolvase